MTVNNINQIRNEILEFSLDKLATYTIMILQRGKDGMPNRNLKQYHINNMEDFDKITKNIPEYCDAHNARAYINVTPKNIKSVGFELISNISNILKNEQYDGIFDIFNKTIGNSKSIIGSKKWIIDIDTTDEAITNLILNFTKSFTEILSVIKTKNGTHIITYGFNPKDFINGLSEYNTKCGNIEMLNTYYEILMNSPNTLLYV